MRTHSFLLMRLRTMLNKHTGEVVNRSLYCCVIAYAYACTTSHSNEFHFKPSLVFMYKKLCESIKRKTGLCMISIYAFSHFVHYMMYRTIMYLCSINLSDQHLTHTVHINELTQET